MKYDCSPEWYFRLYLKIMHVTPGLQNVKYVLHKKEKK